MRGFRARLAYFLDNNSTFGRITGTLWILICVNVLFIVCSIPIVTAGPAFAAMYHVILKAMRHPDDEISPLREFWAGLKGNWRQALVIWICFLVFVVIAVLDVDIITASGSLGFIRYPVYLISGLVLILVSFTFPVMAAFESSLTGLLKNSFYFASRNPMRAILCAAMYVGPLILTYMDLQRLPLYAFIWCTCGFAVAAAVVSRLLLNDFNHFLPDPAEEEEEEE